MSPAVRRRGPASALTVLLRFAAGETLANLVGASVVFYYSAFVVPPQPLGAERQTVLELNATLLVGYLLVAILVGGVWSTWRFRHVLRWLHSGRGPTQQQREVVLSAPARQLWVIAPLWAVAVLLFGVVNLQYSVDLARSVALATVLGGVTTCTLGYLVAQQLVRPLVGAVLEGRAPSEPTGPRLFVRIMTTWAVGAAVPLVAIALAVLLRQAPTGPSALPVLFLAGLGLLLGLLMTAVTARSIDRPLRDVRRAVTDVGQGRLDTSVAVDDPSEIGLLQAGVNDMTAGLRERQRLADLFGRQVGEEVAQQALARGVRLGGEECDVAVLFVDVVGSTQLAVDHPANEVVELLNGFFSAVVDVVGQNDGYVNKFQGDAALAIWGAPVVRPDSARLALASARELRERLSALPGFTAGIGVSAGPVVAGNVGAAERFEYTVIGDAVNEASRLSELAKQTEYGVLCAGRAVADAGEAEQRCWRRLGAFRLRGRTRETAVFGLSAQVTGGKTGESTRLLGMALRGSAQRG